MSLNKLLCKYLDRDGKGYVTMGNLITAASALAGLLLIITMYAKGAIIGVEFYTSARMIEEMCSPFEEYALAVFVVGTFFAICAVAATILQKTLIYIVEVWYIEIATCERKDGD